MTELYAERVVESSRLEEGEFDALDHPHLNIWLQSARGHPRVSVGYLGRLPIRLRSSRGYRVIHDFKQERVMNYVIFEETEAELRKSFAALMSSAWQHSLDASTGDESLISFLDAVTKMKLLFGRTRKKFSPEELRGLMAELLTLEMLIDESESVSRVVEAWKSPGGSVRDFVFSATRSLEVKSTRPDSGTITVSSVTQLDQNEPGLQLAVWPLVEVDHGTQNSVGLCDLVGTLTSRCRADEKTLHQFEHALDEIGFDLTDDELQDVAYSSNGCIVYDVTEDFPRVRASAVPEQVREISYTLRISDLSKFIADLNVP